MKSDNPDKKHILIISGEPLILAEIKMDLMNCFDISIAATYDSALAALKSYKVAAIVICIGESREDAFSIFSRIFGAAKERNIPIILLAEKGSDADELTAFAMGAVDYSARRRGAINALIDRIRLRISASEHNHPSVEGSALSQPESAPEAALNGKVILIADDVEINREIVSVMFSGIENLTLDFACDGKEAVSKFENDPERFSLILMDVQMPDVDGLEATRIIRSLNAACARHVPIIALTASTDEAEVEKCLDAGMNDILEKPVNYDKMIELAVKYCTSSK